MTQGTKLPLPYTLVHTLRGHQGTVTTVRFNSNGNYCLSCGQDKSIKLWNPHKGVLIKTYTGHGYEVLDVAVTKDNSQIASCGGDRQVFLWDVGTGQPIRRFKGHDSRVNCLAFNEDCSVLISGSYDKTVKIWDCRSRSFTPIQTLSEAKDSVSSLFVSSEEIITACVDGCVRNYDIRTGRLKTDFMGQPCTSVSLSNDANCLLISSLDSSIRLLDKQSGELLGEYKGHVNNQYKIASSLSNTDAYVVSGSEDSRICFWDLVEGKLVHTLKGHEKVVCGISYHPTPDTNMLVSSSQDGTVRVWGP